MEINRATFSRKDYLSLEYWRAHYWQIGLVFTALLLSLPTLVVVSSLFQEYSDVWQHLRQTVLPDYVINSLLLMLGVGFGTFVLGVSCAWITSMCAFPGRKLFQWALLLPMAMPAYIIAYTYTGLLDFTGPLQTQLRSYFGWGYGDYWFPEIRSLGGAICMLSLVLYPYVYLIVRAAFLEQSRAVLEVSRTLGNGAWRTLFFVALPLARPAIVAGLSLAMMETLADYGTVQYFGVSTFTTGIFRTWFGLGELQSATQLASLLLLFVFTLMIIERWSRKRMRFHQATGTQRQSSLIKMSPLRSAVCIAVCLLPIFLGFILPALQLSLWAAKTWSLTLNSDFFKLVGNSFLLASTASIICLLLAIFLCYGRRLHKGFIESACVKIASMGYAIPGTVIAVGVLLPFSLFDSWLNRWLESAFDYSPGLLLSGTLVALIFAYVVRFLSVSVQTMETGLEKIRYNLDESARSLGYRPLQVLKEIHFPILRVSLLTALLLVFVDVLKELPTTLILRPFNFNTLAVRAYELASDERLAEASTAALAIVLIGLVPVILLTKTINNSKELSK